MDSYFSPGLGLGSDKSPREVFVGPGKRVYQRYRLRPLSCTGTKHTESVRRSNRLRTKRMDLLPTRILVDRSAESPYGEGDPRAGPEPLGVRRVVPDKSIRPCPLLLQRQDPNPSPTLSLPSRKTHDSRTCPATDTPTVSLRHPQTHT